MASEATIVYPLAQWTSLLTINFFWIIPTCIIVRSEISKRQSTTLSFTSRRFKIFSMSCIIFGSLSVLFYVLWFIPGLCTFSGFAAYLWGIFSFIAMGYYQLCRLYYCFANDQIHSNKGYPKWLFLVMGIMIIPIVISGVFLSIYSGAFDRSLINSKCVYTSLELRFYPISIAINENLVIWHLIIGILHSVWDLITLALYIFKIRAITSYKNIDESVFNRILNILQKITILTLFYEIHIIIFNVSSQVTGYILGHDSFYYFIVYTFIGRLSTFSLFYSMHLMMEHNEKEYYVSLKIVYYLKMHYLCCCWRSMVIDQLTVLSKEYERDKVEKKGPTNMVVVAKQRSIWDTRGPTVDDIHINGNVNEMSELTVTVNDDE